MNSSYCWTDGISYPMHETLESYLAALYGSYGLADIWLLTCQYWIATRAIARLHYSVMEVYSISLQDYIKVLWRCIVLAYKITFKCYSISLQLRLHYSVMQAGV